jgi:hypothetical protein
MWLATTAVASSPSDPATLPLLFDAHIHYNADVRDDLPPERVIKLLDDAGIDRAFVSSTPTDGTERLYRLAPGRIVPLLRPYRTTADRRTWYRDPDLLARLEERLAAFPYRGIGEFHVFGEDASTPVVGEMIKLAVERGLFLQAHADRDAIERILMQAGDLTVIWAHAGFDVPVSDLAALLEWQPRLLLELSYRSDIAPGGRLDPRWRELFIAHPDRFLVGMDTHLDDRWDQLELLAQEARKWLDQLPPDVAQRIAYGNAAALSGQRRPTMPR